uniref:Putative secreted protein n=1 Tax=Anopheles triannulatus TaxID=58253 RepID=A0A2M4B4U7_9DIPT
MAMVLRLLGMFFLPPCTRWVTGTLPVHSRSEGTFINPAQQEQIPNLYPTGSMSCFMLHLHIMVAECYHGPIGTMALGWMYV